MPSSPSADMALMRAAFLLDSDPAAAVRCAQGVLAAAPGHAQASLMLATALRKLGDPAGAAAALDGLARAQADSAVVQLEFGRAHAAAGNAAVAAAALRRAVAIDPSLSDAWRELATLEFAAGATLAGDQAYAHYLRLTGEPPELGDAARALAEGRPDAAEAVLRQRLQRAPHDVFALRINANLAYRREDHLEAERCLKECLALAPGYAAARFDLAAALVEQQRLAEALAHLERLLALEPENFDCLNLKTRALQLLARTDEALALAERTVAAHPQLDEAWLMCGHLLRELGQNARAIEMFRRALAVRPACGRAYASLANLKTFRFDAADIGAMREQLAVARGEDRIAIEFALGKALEDARDYAASFEHYARGNALHRQTLFYDAQFISAETAHYKEFFSRELFAARAAWGSPQPDPIFIVGVPRSGSTLLEQMLASHSQVEGTHELAAIGRVAFELWSRRDAAGQPTYPQSLAGLTPAQFEELAGRYLSYTQPYRTLGRPRFVDKMLGNFMHVGLIHLMFPRAAIIDVRRHPLACGFSCFKLLFARGQKFSYNLHELGRYYHDYVELMQHFDAVLPGRVLRVSYERLVAEPRGELQRLLEYCGLPFEEQCLRFYENPRVVRTISSEQVRQPLYTESIEHWRHYEPWLGPLKAALAGVLPAA